MSEPFLYLNMNLEELRKICMSLPYVTEDIKWESDLSFCIGEKMFCVTNLDTPFSVTLKVKDEEFDELCFTEGIIPARYLARYKWIQIINANRFTNDEWQHYIAQSYQLIKSKLSKKITDKLL